MNNYKIAIEKIKNIINLNQDDFNDILEEQRCITCEDDEEQCDECEEIQHNELRLLKYDHIKQVMNDLLG